MNDDNKKWTEVELPPLKIEEPPPSDKITIDLRAVKYLLQNKSGAKKIKFHDGELVSLPKKYKIEII